MGTVCFLSVTLGPLFGALAVGGIVSDIILPRCPRLLRALGRLLNVDLGG